MENANELKKKYFIYLLTLAIALYFLCKDNLEVVSRGEVVCRWFSKYFKL